MDRGRRKSINNGAVGDGTNRGRQRSRNRRRNNRRAGAESEEAEGNWGQRNDNRGQKGSKGGGKGGNANNNRNRNPYKPHHMPFKLAEQLGDNEDAEEVIQAVLNDRNGFKELLKMEEITGDFLVLIIHMLTRICDSSFTDSKVKIFHVVFTHSDYSKQLTRFISDLPNQSNAEKRSNSYFWKDTDKFWNNLLIVFEDMTTFPSFASQNLPVLLKVVKRNLPVIEEEHSIHISDSIKEKFDTLLIKVQNMVSEYAQKPQNERGGGYEDEDSDENTDPPNDFRLMKVYPNIIEVTAREQPYLRKNRIKGSYTGIYHYLDVQFRLLREDFVAPLRKGICQYLDNPNQRRHDDVRIYPKIQFLSKENINELNCFRMQYDFSNKKKTLKYENSKLFMYGSLVCFTKDRFRNLIFGKIVKRDVELLKKSELVVGFDEHEDISFKTDYIMVESSVYFEPYYHVLTALQRMSLEQFPMERYIIYGEAVTYPPQYLSGGTCYIIDKKEIFPLLWYRDETHYGLNDSQQRAFKAALTQEITVIQGPPGTGKTFLGLKIAQTLLQNDHAWYEHNPMLVICYTNHALDQFLEGILPFTRNRLLRIGGQSKNETLNKYNLKNLTRTKKSGTFYQTQRELKVCLSDLKSYDGIIGQILQYDSVIDFSYFYLVVPNFDKTWFYSATKEDIKKWLLEEVEGKAERGNSTADFSRNYYLKKSWGAEDDSNSDSEDEYGSEEDDEEEDDTDEIYNQIKILDFKPLISLKSMKAEIATLERKLQAPFTSNIAAVRHNFEQSKIRNELFSLNQKYEYLENKLEQIRTTNAEIVNPNKNPYLMTPKQRWMLYSFWLKQYCQLLHSKRQEVSLEYQEKHKMYLDQRNIEDVKIMREKLVVGMTTTGAARLRTSLEALRSPIVIVEEAAEILEAHVISALTNHCQHLILIGDHKQLKPSTADYQMERNYLLGVSLFERMVNNNLQCFRLNVQHRMKPKICDLIRPDVYPDLRDDVSVEHRPSIIYGVDKDLFFIHHQNQENACDNSSKKNTHEAKFLISLAKHLILNGYKAENITILAAYLGQMFEMQRERKKHYLLLRNVRIAVLDNYQGEESDIILLSLVRSNKEGQIGFLKIENRVCVALSRARNGLYIMGNMNLLCSNSKLWCEIKKKLEKQNALGTSLALRCRIHDKITSVTNEEDFNKAPEGGCNLTCNAKLVCGHSCKNICHLQDRDHKNYDCLEPCESKLCNVDESHVCKKRCFEECGPCYYPVRWILGCDHECTLQCHVDANSHKCTELVSTKLGCGHTANKPCHLKPEEFLCPHPCDKIVDPCGHACTLLCHIRNDPDHLQYKCTKPCAKYRVGCTSKKESHMCRNKCYEQCEPCEINVNKSRTICSHFFAVPCNTNVDLIKCEKPCTRTLPCGHKCKNKCRETCGPCTQKVQKIIPECGHAITTKCCEVPERKHCKQKCARKLYCGHTCDKKCKEDCTTTCQVEITCSIHSLCGHPIKRIKCYKRGLLPYDPSLLEMCTQPCNVQLNCKHKCKGTCATCFQGRIHARCGEKCGVYLVCNHECPIPCREACKPCERKCSYRCIHSSCNKKCGDICVKCTEKCPRTCIHQRCTKPCGDICSVGPCEQPCLRILKCGHPCVGFCNDPCPRQCRICDRDELCGREALLFGTEDEEDARFVVLQDCNHVLESTGMKYWLSQEGDQIQTKVCPKCKAPIINTQRYRDYVKRTMLDIRNVKEKLIGTSVLNNQRRTDLMGRIYVVKLRSSRLRSVTNFTDVIGQLEKRLQESRVVNSTVVRQPINGLVLDAVTSKIQILEYILEICCSTMDTFTSPEIEKQIRFILNSVVRDEDQITVQEIEDIELEIDRLKRIVEIFQIKGQPVVASRDLLSVFGFRRVSDNTQSKPSVEAIEELVITFKKYTKATDNIVQGMLKKLNTRVPISDAERREIVKALGLSKGRWYKCPNGHPYVITECGGAMQQTNCPECGEKIGGSSHRVLSTNRFAPEMDEASAPLWSPANNIENYDFRL